MSSSRPIPRRLDPTGKRALFETPVTAAPDTVRGGSAKSGRDALFSTGPRTPRSVVVHCSACEARTRIGFANVAVRLAALSAYLPLLRPTHPHRMRCPACERFQWCRIDWTG